MASWWSRSGGPKRPARRSGVKSDALDALRAAREALARDQLVTPWRRGEREALRVLLATRHSACRAKVAAINQLKALIVGAPEGLRAELERLVAAIAPWLLELSGVGPISAAQVLVSWSHADRLRSEAAFAALAGVNPIPASSGQVIRHRLNRGGDRQLNRALHTIVLARLRDDPQQPRLRGPPEVAGQEHQGCSPVCEASGGPQLFKLLERYDPAQVRPATVV